MPEQFTEEQMKRLGLAIVTALRALREQIKYTHIAMHKAGKATSCELPEKTIIIRAVVCLKNKLNRHITSYGVHQTDIDFYKVTAWLGMMLYKNSGAPPLLSFGIWWAC